MRRLLPLLLVCLCLSACGGINAVPTPSPSPLPAPTPAPASSDAGVRVYVDGLLRLRGYAEGEELYLSPLDICRLFGIQAEEEQDDDGYTLSTPGWKLNAPAGESVFTADGRYLYCPGGCRVFDGRVCLPRDVTERLFGLQIRFDGQRADIDESGFRLMRGGSGYYSSHFPADDLFWLSHIIFSEARWEPLAGQIGVGNVVLNRVASEKFPDTVMTVVLDREHVIQFDPVGTGEVAEEPDEQSVIAACLVLEGYNTVGESLFFVNPERGDDSWFREELTPTVTIGLHHFYA